MPLMWYKIEKVTHLTEEKVIHLNFQVVKQVDNFLY